jgi:hypothetical protein
MTRESLLEDTASELRLDCQDGARPTMFLVEPIA